MSPSDIVQLNAHLQRLYGDRYPGLTTEMAALWYQELRHFPAEVGPLAIRRWAADHLPYQIPTLNQLAAVMEDVQRDQRQTARLAHALQPNGPEPEGDASYNTAEIRQLINSVWPDMFAPTPEPLKEEERTARIDVLREQARQILAEKEQA
jgi:hypothetical protein